MFTASTNFWSLVKQDTDLITYTITVTHSNYIQKSSTTWTDVNTFQ